MFHGTLVKYSLVKGGVACLLSVVMVVCTPVLPQPLIDLVVGDVSSKPGNLAYGSRVGIWS